MTAQSGRSDRVRAIGWRLLLPLVLLMLWIVFTEIRPSFHPTLLFNDTTCHAPTWNE